ncbi:hypothetical protein C8R45DRAFT_1068907 [Mycena sanguinolenta]|nr:hypothetical protein C8R45DRAFT_1068907 [Mycena sanguinolenta]
MNQLYNVLGTQEDGEMSQEVLPLGDRLTATVVTAHSFFATGLWAGCRDHAHHHAHLLVHGHRDSQHSRGPEGRRDDAGARGACWMRAEWWGGLQMSLPFPMQPSHVPDIEQYADKNWRVDPRLALHAEVKTWQDARDASAISSGQIFGHGGQLQTLVAVNTESIIHDKDHRAYATLVGLEQWDAPGIGRVHHFAESRTCASYRLKSIYANDVKLALRCPWSEAGGEWGVACNYGATTKNYGVRRELRNFGQTMEHYVDGTLHYDHYSNYRYYRQLCRDSKLPGCPTLNGVEEGRHILRIGN